ncbi:MAG TPA: LptA/OstA family protein [Candidatus Polarisedimenticolia bacterium]|jgi:lipopolysaccharide transport protein LptA
MALIRSLRLVLLLGLAGLVSGIVLSLSANVRGGPPRPSDTGARELPGSARLAQQAFNVEIVRTREGRPTLRLKALESRSYTDGRLDLTNVVFHLFGPAGRETIVEAPTASSLAPADDLQPAGAAGPPAAGAPEAMGSWQLEGGVTVRTADGLTLLTPRLAYHEADGQATTQDSISFARGPATGTAVGMTYEIESQIVRFLRDVTTSMPLGGMGLVRVEAVSATHDLKNATLEMRDYRAVTGRGENLSGSRLVASFLEGGGVQSLTADQGFVLESSHAVSTPGTTSPLGKLLALEGTRTMRGFSLAMQFGAGSEPTSIEVSGDALLTALDSARGDAPSSIAARTLRFDLTGGNLTRARAEGEVDLKGAPAEGESAGFRLLSDHLDAVFDPNLGTLTNLEGQGEIHLSDREMRSEGSHTVLDPNSDIVTLTGEQGKPASASWLKRKIQADRIEADRRQKTLSAKGGVRASYEPPRSDESVEGGSAGQALPFFKEGETIYVMAGSLTFAEQGKLAHYRDRVRLWQGENRLEASEVDVNESEGTLEARGEVVNTFRQPAPANQARPSGNPSEQIVTVAASTMKYERGANCIAYGGRVLVTQGALRVTSDSMIVTLSADGGGAELMEAAGNVALSDSGRTGNGDRLIADPKADTLKLIGSGREASVQDSTGQQVVRGLALTMDRSGDRILVESEVGGRTWITLKPRQKGAPGVGPVPRD